MSTINNCLGFKPHSINPNRCRRCFKDITDHNESTTSGTTGNGNDSKQGRTLIKTQRSHSLKLDELPSSYSKTRSQIASPSSTTTTTPTIIESPSVSYTLKTKKVKFSDNGGGGTGSSRRGTGDNDDDENDGDDNGNSNKNSSNNNSVIDDGSPVEVAFTVCVNKKHLQQQQRDNNNETDYQCRIKELSNELSKSKEKIDLLEMKNKELENMRKTFGKTETIKTNFDDLTKLKQKLNDLEQENRSLRQEKKSIENQMMVINQQQGNNNNNNNKVGNQRNSSFSLSSSNSTSSSLNEMNELRRKLSQSEKIIQQLTQENEDIKKDVKELEIEFQELHDNFREDQTSEFRVIKHELESMSKNCRVLQFKLKKSERTIEQLENEKLDMKKQLQDLYETTQMDFDKRKMKELENELTIAKEVSLKLHAEIEQLKSEQQDSQQQQSDNQSKTDQQQQQQSRNNNNNNNKFAKLSSPSPSFDQNNNNNNKSDYEQIVRDLYDTMEREKDLQEQLKFSEEETRTMRKKLSTMEQENEILMLQIRKMAMKNNQQPKDDDDDSEELNPEEMKLHLELYEQEMIVLRRKTDELEQENENFQQEIKYLQEKLISQPTITKIEIPEIPLGSPPNVIYEHKIKILETETRELRKKLVDKERENESLRTEVELHRRRASKVINRSRSLDSEGQSLDMKKQLQLFEQEAQILRQKMITLENENEKLSQENKRLQLRISKKPPPSNVDQLQMENLELKEKLKEFERKCDTLKMDLMNTKLNETTQTETDYIANLKKQLRSKENDLANLQAKLTKIDIEMAKINREYKKLKDSLNPRRRVNRVIRETATRLELKEIIKDMEDELEQLHTNIRGKDAIIENLTEEVSELKRTFQEFEQKQQQQQKQNIQDNNNGNNNSGNNQIMNELNKRLEEEQHKAKSLQEKLDKLTKSTAAIGTGTKPETLKISGSKMGSEQQQLEISNKKLKDLEEKLSKEMKNNDELNLNNKKLHDDLKKSKEEFLLLTKKLKNMEKIETELNEKISDIQKELEHVLNINKQLENQVNNNKNGKSKIPSITTTTTTTTNASNNEKTFPSSSSTSSVSAASSPSSSSSSSSSSHLSLTKECTELKRKLEEYRINIDQLKNQLENQRLEFKERESKLKEESNQKIDSITKNVRKEIHLELQMLREESTTYKNRNQELLQKLEKLEKELKENNERFKSITNQSRKEQNDLQEKFEQIENQLKIEQRKKEKLEKELEISSRGKEEELLRSQEKIIQLEREIRRYQAKIDDIEYDYNNRLTLNEKELNKLKQDYDDLTQKYELLEKDYVDLKSRSIQEKDTLVDAVNSLKTSYEDKLSEIKILKENLMSQRKEWYKEKLTFQERIADLESKLNKTNLVEEERNRLKKLLGEKENLLNSYRKEERQHNEDRERNRIKIETLQNRITELERFERNSKFMNITGRAQVDKELQDYRIRLEHSETSHKGELAALHAEYEGRMRLLGDEVEHLQKQLIVISQERDRYRDSIQKYSSERKNFNGTLGDEIEDLNSQLRIIRSDLEGALLENRNLKIQHGTEKSSWQIQIAEYKTQINQLEERILLETRGSTRNYARTKMELAWEKERQENLRLLQDTQKFIQELRNKLLELENIKEKERQEAHRQLLELKNTMDQEQSQTQKNISELQLDLLSLKEVYARLKSQNERYKRERSSFDKARMDFLQQEMLELRKILEKLSGTTTTTPSNTTNNDNNSKTASNKNNNKSAQQQQENNKELIESISQLQERLQKRFNDLIQESRSTSSVSFANNNGRYVVGNNNNNGSSTSLSSTNNLNLPLPSLIKRAPPRLKSSMFKKSLSLDQQHLPGGSSNERIWDSDHSLNSTPNSSISNLRSNIIRAGTGTGAGYESDSSGSSVFGSANNPAILRLRSGFVRDHHSYGGGGSFGYVGGGGSDSDTSIISLQQQPTSKKKTLKDRFKFNKNTKSSSPATATNQSSLNDNSNNDGQKLMLYGFDKSPIELAKQREKKEKSLRYKISKTLSKTFSRSASVLSEASIPEQVTTVSGHQQPAQQRMTRTATKSPTRSKSPEIKKLYQEPGVAVVVPGIAQLKQKPTQSNLAIPPSKQSPPPKIKFLRSETNV